MQGWPSLKRKLFKQCRFQIARGISPGRASLPCRAHVTAPKLWIQNRRKHLPSKTFFCSKREKLKKVAVEEGGQGKRSSLTKGG